jgi:hypothetical protein
MIASILILVLSACMFLYWLRYTCLLVLETVPPQDYRDAVIAAHELISIDQVKAAGNMGIGDLHRLLDRDYQTLQDLLSRCPMAGSIEHRLLMFDYHIMKLWSTAVRPLYPAAAREATREMAKVLDYFAAEVGAASA